MGAVGFGPKMAWLAVRHDDPVAVLTALDLRDLGLTDVRSGLDMAYFTDDRVVVTPPIGGWVLVAGKWLFGLPSAAGPSVTLGTEVQYFATHRGLLTHRWERAVEGDLFDVFRSGDEEDDDLVDERDVFRTAAQWSVDPRRLPVGTLHIAAVPGNA
ncbi:hypothetical protein Drose_27465 [Dactylosporangium roseum]|uniref:Uncharacterized protein n=1 Tax=Dactylosporangium roseum TaxID=47989 RepID=A0ABY5YYR9_9ACTN|nr:hypothetical protein [Dactylosporangium roseum]UWZ34896.1 hypothetical protein Drose_27465 [Dactylosporangium roseum]